MQVDGCIIVLTRLIVYWSLGGQRELYSIMFCQNWTSICHRQKSLLCRFGVGELLLVTRVTRLGALGAENTIVRSSVIVKLVRLCGKGPLLQHVLYVLEYM
jgi:hypothetical protein